MGGGRRKQLENHGKSKKTSAAARLCIHVRICYHIRMFCFSHPCCLFGVSSSVCLYFVCVFENDISDNWPSMIANIQNNAIGSSAGGPGHWNDPDMIEVGNGGMTVEEYVTHFSLWAIAKAPLIIGCDVTNMTADTLHILTNQAVINVNQDPLGIQGTAVYNSSNLQVWSGALVDGWAVVLVNIDDAATQELGFTFASIGAPASGTFQLVDLWSNEIIQPVTGGLPPVTLEPHQSRMFKVTQIKHTKIVLTEQ